MYVQKTRPGSRCAFLQCTDVQWSGVRVHWQTGDELLRALSYLHTFTARSVSRCFTYHTCTQFLLEHLWTFLPSSCAKLASSVDKAWLASGTLAVLIIKSTLCAVLSRWRHCSNTLPMMTVSCWLCWHFVVVVVLSKFLSWCLSTVAGYKLALDADENCRSKDARWRM